MEIKIGKRMCEMIRAEYEHLDVSTRDLAETYAVGQTQIRYHINGDCEHESETVKEHCERMNTVDQPRFATRSTEILAREDVTTLEQARSVAQGRDV